MQGRKIEKKPWTDKEVRQRLANVYAGKEKPTSFRVFGSGKGLTLEPATDPAKWNIIFKEQGKQRRRYLGTYPKISLKEARDLAVFFWAHGKRLPKDMKAGAASERTIADLWEPFVKAQLGNRWEYGDAEQDKLTFGRNHILPWVGKLRLEEVTVQNVADMMSAAISDNNQKRRRQYLNMLFVWAKDTGLTELDNFPTASPSLDRLVKPAAQQPKKRDSLPWHEIPRFIADLVKGGFSAKSPARQLLLLSALTASRPQQVRFAEWNEVHPVIGVHPETEEEVSVPAWVCPFEHMKAKHKSSTPISQRHDFVVPLSDQAQDLLRLLGDMRTSDNPLIFPSRITHGVISDSTANSFLKKLSARNERDGGSGYRDTWQDGRVFTQHGFRASFQTWANEKGKSLIAAEASLAHKNTGQDTQGGRYNRSSQLFQKKELLQAWADFCMRDCPPDWCKRA